ncbi:MAG: hypothetical protein ACK5L5_09265 [Bacteroidales bacterium]
MLTSCKNSSYYYPTGPQRTNIEGFDVECIAVERMQNNLNAYFALNNTGPERVIKIDGIDHSIIGPDGSKTSGEIDSVRFGDILKNDITNKTLVGETVPENETRIVCISFSAQNFPKDIDSIHSIKVRLMIENKKVEAVLYNMKIDKPI